MKYRLPEINDKVLLVRTVKFRCGIEIDISTYTQYTGRPYGASFYVQRMDTAGYDISSVTSMVAGGCNAVIFTTGRGTPTGNAIVPVLKVTANERTFKMMDDNMDVDLSPILRGEKTYKEMGRELIGVISDVMNGKLTKAEAYGFSDIAVDHVCRFV